MIKGQHQSYKKSKTQVQQANSSDFQRVATQHFPSQKIRYFENKKQEPETQNISTVFNKSQKLKSQKNLELSLILHSAVQDKIADQIQSGNVQIKPKFINLNDQKIIKKNKQVSQKEVKQKLIEMQKKKINTIRELKRIQQEQIDLKRKSISFRLQKVREKQKHSLKKQRSFFSPDQKQEVKKMLKRKSQLQAKLNQKTIQALKRYQQSCQLEQMRQRQQIQKQKQLHRSFVQKNQKKIQNKKLQRIELLEKGKKNFKQVKNKKYLYQDKEQIQLQKELQQKIQIQKKIQSIKDKMRITTTQDIKQHQQKYKQLIKSKIQQKKTIPQLHQTKIVKKKIQQNYFTKLVKNEIQFRRQTQIQSKKRPFQLKSKAKEFTHQYELQIKPKIKSNNQSRFIPIIKNNSVHSLGYYQQRNQGNEYMSIAKKLKKWQSSEQQKILEMKTKQTIDKQKESNRSYKNYLKELKQTRRNSQDNPQISRRFYNFLQKQGTIAQYNSLTKAVFIAQSMESISKKSKDQRLIDSVQNKINILKMII